MSDTTKGDARKTDKHHDSTWGATPEAKEAWDEQHGDKARKATERAVKAHERAQAAEEK